MKVRRKKKGTRRSKRSKKVNNEHFRAFPHIIEAINRLQLHAEPSKTCVILPDIPQMRNTTTMLQKCRRMPHIISQGLQKGILRCELKVKTANNFWVTWKKKRYPKPGVRKRFSKLLPKRRNRRASCVSTRRRRISSRKRRRSMSRGSGFRAAKRSRRSIGSSSRSRSIIRPKRKKRTKTPVKSTSRHRHRSRRHHHRHGKSRRRSKSSEYHRHLAPKQQKLQKHLKTSLRKSRKKMSSLKHKRRSNKRHKSRKCYKEDKEISKKSGFFG